MKLLKLVGILMLMTFLTGCYNPGKDTPENLLNELPVYDVNEEKIYKNVQRVLGGADLILPSNSVEVGKINKVDLNEDGQNEIVFFQKRDSLDEKDNSVGFTILDSENDISYDTTYTQKGSSIKYANFYDLDNDGKKEIILLIQDESEVTLNISKYINGKIENIISKENFNYFNKDGYNSLDIAIEDINNDRILDLIVYNYNQETTEMNLYVANFKDNQIIVKDSMKFDNIKSSQNINVDIGNLRTKQKGLFLSLLDNESNKYITRVVYMKNNKLTEVLKDSKEVSNCCYIPFEDINKDGITDIPVVQTVSNDNLDANASKSSATISWYKYDISSEHERKLFQIQIYYNYEYNFKFFIPNNLVDKIYINEEFDINSKLFRFSYYDLKNEKPKDLFTLTLIEKNANDNTDSISKTSTNILDSGKYTLSISNANTKELEKLDLNMDVITDYFSKIND